MKYKNPTQLSFPFSFIFSRYCASFLLHSFILPLLFPSTSSSLFLLLASVLFLSSLISHFLRQEKSHTARKHWIIRNFATGKTNSVNEIPTAKFAGDSAVKFPSGVARYQGIETRNALPKKENETKSRRVSS